MAEIKLYKQDGSEAGSVKLSDELFAAVPNQHIVHEVLVAQLANGRAVISTTKDRSEVRGGGKKPWKQKGTGRARHGSRRSPIWIGGGITFGPRLSRVFAKKVNKKMRQKALRMVLSDKVTNDAFIAVEAFDLPEAKTKHAAAMRKALPASDKAAVIVITVEEDAMRRAVRNLENTTTIYAHSLNVRDLLASHTMIASKAAIALIEKTYLV